MKIRTCFVSNSSVSSFIVRIMNHRILKQADNLIATPEDIKKLKDFGFKDSNLTNPFNTDEMAIITGEDNKYLSMKYSVVCNQDEVTYFLVSNNIPFVASIHYDQEYCSYKRDSDYILEAANYGQIMAMYGEDYYEYFEMMDSLEPIKKRPKNEWLKFNKIE